MTGSEKTYEMMWDCEYCGEKKLLGVTHRHCPNCGAVQNPERRYFPPDNEKVAVQDHQFVGADVHCPSCREAMSAAVKCCTNCGSPMQGGAQAARQADQLVGPGGAAQQMPGQYPQQAAGQYPQQAAGQYPMGAAPGAAAPAKKGSKIGIIIGAIVAVIVLLIVVRMLWKTEAALKVDGHKWTREIAVEVYGEFKEKGPCKSMPAGAKVTNRSTPKPKCKTRKIDRGDGTFKEKKECDKPVEQCSYTVTKWKQKRTAKETGDGVDSTPKWPKVKLRKKGRCVGCEREGKRMETYTVVFKDSKSKDTHSCSFSSASKWKSYSVGDSYKAKKNVVGGDLDCDTLKRAK